MDDKEDDLIVQFPHLHHVDFYHDETAINHIPQEEFRYQE